MIKDDYPSNLKPADIRKTAGLSYRQLNDWDEKGVLPRNRRRGAGWRTFSFRDAFAILVCAEIRAKFGVPLQSLRWVREFMLQKGANHFRFAVEMMSRGLAVYVLTDLKQEFVLHTDLEFADKMLNGSFGGDNPRSCILLKVNPLVNRLLSCLDAPVEFTTRDEWYRIAVEARRAKHLKLPQQDNQDERFASRGEHTRGDAKEEANKESNNTGTETKD